MKKILYYFSLGLLLWVSAMNSTYSQDSLTYLALGDSYTIGESVTVSNQWPVKLVNALQKKGLAFEAPRIIARTGWRTDQLFGAMSSIPSGSKYELVSVLIGVNNQFQGRDLATYRIELGEILDQAILLSKNGKEGVFMLSIPDYGATPYGNPRADQIGSAIDEWNQLAKKVATEKGIPFWDITAISREWIRDPYLVAEDGLHPSGKQYQRWVDEWLEEITALLIKD